MLLCEKENLGRYSNFLPRNCMTDSGRIRSFSKKNNNAHLSSPKIIGHPAVRLTGGCRGRFVYSFMISRSILAPRRKLFWNNRHSAMS